MPKSRHNPLHRMVDQKDFRLVGRSTKEISDVTGLSQSEVLTTLAQYRTIARTPCGLWGFVDGECNLKPDPIERASPVKAKPSKEKAAKLLSKEPDPPEQDDPMGEL